MAWVLFNWGSRGPHYRTDIPEVIVATDLIPRAIQVTLFGRYRGALDLLHTFHCEAPASPVVEADLTAVNTAVTSWATTSYQTLLTAETRLVRVVSTAIDVLNGPQAEESINLLGGRAGNPLPPAVTLSVKKTGVNRGRSRRGRFYTWPAATADVTGELFHDAYVVEAVASWNALLAALDTAGVPMVIASFVDEALHPVRNCIAVNSAIDAMRSRNLGHGR